MKVAGIIAEYNPFHKGHLYQIQVLKEMGFDSIVVVMSGDFLQRGCPALSDKYQRAEAALDAGVDLVLELPVIYSTASASYFASAGVEILKQLKVVTHLCFGAECEDLSLLQTLSSLLSQGNPLLEEKIQSYQRRGLSFPSARAKALLEEKALSGYDLALLENVLASPNNILAIEYLKHTDLTPVLIPRKGQGYHDLTLGNLASASAIRKELFSHNGNITKALENIKASLPEHSYRLLCDYSKEASFLCSDSFSLLLYYALLSNQEEGYQAFADISQSLNSKIKKSLSDFQSFDLFVDQLKSKDITSSRISRGLLHILLGIKKEYYNCAVSDQVYGRILGFHKSKSSLLGQIKKEASLPLITKVADASSILNDVQTKVFSKDLLASDLYNQVLFANGSKPRANDFRHNLIMPE